MGGHFRNSSIRQFRFAACGSSAAVPPSEAMAILSSGTPFCLSRDAICPALARARA